MKLIAVLILALILTACGNQSNDHTTESENSLEMPLESTSTINLSSFQESEFPKAIDGCACYYKEKGKDGYIYVDDFARIAFIKIGDTFESLEIYESHDENGLVHHKCRAEHYGISVNLKETGHEDETWQYEGYMEINKIDGSKKTIQITAECGC